MIRHRSVAKTSPVQLTLSANAFALLGDGFGATAGPLFLTRGGVTWDCVPT